MKEKIIAFLTDTVKEMKKVTWPTWSELRESTMVVIVVCMVIALFVFGVAWLVSNLMKAI
jgi:preprotein translocase subunit SecE